MKRLSRARQACVLMLLLSASAAADTFVLKDGRRIEGKLARETAEAYFVQTGVGEVELKKAQVTERIFGKTARDTFADMEAKAVTAEDFFQLGQWASEQKLKSNAIKAWKRAVELDPKHEGANLALGNVLYKGEWMTPELRDQRAAADEEADMLAKGLVRYQERWVTPDEREKLEQGLVLFDGRWMSVAESMQLQGFEQYDGQWLPRAETLARRDVDAVGVVLGRTLARFVSKQAVVAGDYDLATLESTSARIDQGRAWFDRAYQAAPGLEWLGGRMAEFYLWNRDSLPYVNTVDHFEALTETVGPEWAAAVKKIHGFFWIDPYTVSSARVWHRPDPDLVGHCVHHWGHMMLGRLGYDGRLLPPWYDEGLAAVTEFRVFGRNSVFCLTGLVMPSTPDTPGTRSRRGSASTYSFDTAVLHQGKWLETLKKALEAKAVPAFDYLARKEFPELEMIDIASGMAIVSWLEEKAPDALSKFHAEIRRTQPPTPERVVQDIKVRQSNYDAAFRAAAGMSTREADQAWRAWVQSR